MSAADRWLEAEESLSCAIFHLRRAVAQIREAGNADHIWPNLSPHLEAVIRIHDLAKDKAEL